MYVWVVPTESATKPSHTQSCGHTRADSDFQQIFVLTRHDRVDLGLTLFDQFFDFLLCALELVFADLTVRFQAAEQVFGVVSRLADRDLGIFALLLHDLGEVLTALLRERGHGDAKDIAVTHRIETEWGLHDGFFDHLKLSFVPRLHGQHARFGCCHGGHLRERHLRAVDLDANRLEQRGMGAARANLREVTLERVVRLGDVCSELRNHVGDHMSSQTICFSQVWFAKTSEASLTTVPIGSPNTTRRMLPRAPSANTRIGKLLSRQSVTAVLSITPMRAW